MWEGGGGSGLACWGAHPTPPPISTKRDICDDVFPHVWFLGVLPTPPHGIGSRVVFVIAPIRTARDPGGAPIPDSGTVFLACGCVSGPVHLVSLFN